MANGWTPERKEKQSALMRMLKPWERSTGPKTDEGKARAARNSRRPPAGTVPKSAVSVATLPRAASPAERIRKMLDTLFTADGRRRKRLTDLVDARPVLQAAYDHAIETGSDSTDELFRELESLDREIRVAQAAVDATDAAAAQAKRDAKREAVSELEHQALYTFEGYVEAMVVLERLISIDVVEKLEAAELAFSGAYAAERAAAGSSVTTVSGRSVIPTDGWNLIWARVYRARHKAKKRDLGAPHRTVSEPPTVEAAFGRELDAVRTTITKDSE